MRNQNNATLFRVTQQFTASSFELEDKVTAEWLSVQYRTTLCGCDPLARVETPEAGCTVEYLFYEYLTDGTYIECDDPRYYVDSLDFPFLDEIEHLCPADRQCLRERSGQIDEYDEYDGNWITK